MGNNDKKCKQLTGELNKNDKLMKAEQESQTWTKKVKV